MPQETSSTGRVRRPLEFVLRAVVVLSCLAFPLAVFLFVSPQIRRVTWQQEEFYYVLLGATVGLAFIAFYFAYKEFNISGKVGIHLMSVSFLLFSLLLFAQSLLLAEIRPILVESFGAHARLVFSLFFMMGVLASTERMSFEPLRRLSRATLNWFTIGMIAVASGYVLMLRNGLDVKLSEETIELLSGLNSALDVVSVACLAVAVLSLSAIYTERRNPMALVLALGAGFAIEATFFFSIGATWEITWWLAHAVVVLGLIVLTYGMVLITHTRESDQLLFDLQFSQQELERMQKEQSDLQQNIERMRFVVTVSDSLRHQILNPHTVIGGNARILLNSQLDESQRLLLEAIGRQSQKVVEVLDQYRSLREKVELQQYQDGVTQIIDMEKSR